LHAVALCRHRTGDLQGAVADYSRLLRANPQFSDALLARGNAYMDYGHEQVYNWVTVVFLLNIYVGHGTGVPAGAAGL
jgi:tetratricopeptide (TPR) repeat protein